MVVLLDANVLYPAPVRDILLSLAANKMFQPKWTGTIMEEWIRSLLEKRPDIRRAALTRTAQAMNTAFPGALIEGYEELIPMITLPDANDRHVLAAALRGGAELIITFNLKDFPLSIIGSWGIQVMHPDDFIVELIKSDPDATFNSFEAQVSRLQNPPRLRDYVLDRLIECGLPNTAEVLRLPGNRYMSKL